MHENQRIHRSSADQIRRNDSLSKCGWCTEYAVLVNEYSFDRILLLGPKLTMKDSIDLRICLPSNCRSGTRISDSGADTVVVARCGIEDKDKCLSEPSRGLGVRYPSFHVLAFARCESNSPPGNRCHGIGVRPRRSPAGAAGSHSGVPNHREAGVRTVPESCWPVPAHAPTAESRSGCYSPPTADSAPSVPRSIQSTDRVGPSSKPEKTTTNKPAPALHSGNARDNADSLPPARDTPSSDAVRSILSTTASRSGSGPLAVPAVRTPPRFLPGWLAVRWPRSAGCGVALAVPSSAPAAE